MTHQLGLALRRLRDTPGFTAIALASLAFGMGLNILIFSFTSPVLFKAMPYPEPDRLLDVSMAPPDKPESKGVVTPALYLLLRDKTSAAFEAVGAFDAGRSANLAGDASGPAERLDGHRISATGLAALGARPLLGRLPVAADEQASAAPTIVLSYPVWQRRFAGRPDVVGQTVKVDGQPTQILGVMPEGFGLLDNSSDAWFAFGFEPAPGQETQHNLRAIARLKPGVSMAEAQAAVKVALDEYAQKFPNHDEGWTVELTPWREARFGGMRRPLTMAQLAVGVMLLLVCVSVAVLMRARTVLGERSAVLASRQIRPGVVLAESLLLALGGGAIGAALTALSTPGAPGHHPDRAPASQRGRLRRPRGRVHCRPHRLCDAGGWDPAGVASLADRHRDKGVARRDDARGARGRPGGAGIRAHRRDRSCDASGWRSARSRRRHQPGGSAERRRVPAARPVRHSQRFRGRRAPRSPSSTPRARPSTIAFARRCRRRRASSRRRAWALTRSPQTRSCSSGSGTRNTRPTTGSRRSTWPSRKTTSTRWGFASFVAGISLPPISPTRRGWSS